MRRGSEGTDSKIPSARTAAMAPEGDGMIPQLPFGPSSFFDIQAAPDILYVDKTRLLAPWFAQRHSPHLFLARPRRFGKSLLLSTVEALFQGRRDLFVDTWIGKEGHWDWERCTRPVVRLNLGLRSVHTPDALRGELRLAVRATAQALDLALDPADPPHWMLRHLVGAAARRARQRVVVLVDEYDTAVTENLDRPAVLPDILDVLRAFYGALKDCADANLVEYTWVTGILRLAHTGLFSGANHLVDLSHKFSVNDLLGFTHTELHEPRLAALVAQGARNLRCTPDELYAALERQYNGYRFAEGAAAVFNPYTLAGCLQELAIPDEAARWRLDRLPRHWIRTGTPALLLRGLQTHAPRDTYDPDLSDPRMLEEVNVDAGQPNMTALMYQTGYLTRGSGPDAALIFPNREVATAFRGPLAQWWRQQHQVWLDSRAGQAAAQRRDALTDALIRGNAAAVQQVLGAILAARGRPLRGLPAAVRHIADYEVYWQDLLAVLFDAWSLSTTVEVPAGAGRADLALEWEGRVLFLVELKMGGGAEAGLRQAFARNYPALFQGRGLPVTVVGLQFDPQTRTLATCRLHRLGRFDPAAARWDREPFPVSLTRLQGQSAEERTAYVHGMPLRKAAFRPQARGASGR